MGTHKHAYQRLSDDAVFCPRCGDIKRSEPPICTLPHFPYVPYVPPITVPYIPPWPPYQPYQPPYWWTVINSPTTNATYWPPDNLAITDVTYDVQ